MGRRLVPGNPFVAVTVEARETSRDRVLSDAELAEAWNAAGTLGYPFGPFIRLLILTLQRRGEVAGMRWDELAPDLSTWTIPGHRTKNDKAHIVHLAPAARTVLRQVKRTKGAQLVFTTTGDTPISAFTRARARLAEAIDEARALSAEAAGTKPPPKRAKKPDRGWTLHDLRRTGVTKLAALGIPPYVADRVLNHVQGTIRGVAAVYQRHEFLAERLAAIETWAEFVLQNAAGAEAPPKSPQSAKKQQTKRKITPAN
jgi:integrase